MTSEQITAYIGGKVSYDPTQLHNLPYTISYTRQLTATSVKGTTVFRLWHSFRIGGSEVPTVVEAASFNEAVFKVNIQLLYFRKRDGYIKKLSQYKRLMLPAAGTTGKGRCGPQQIKSRCWP